MLSWQRQEVAAVERACNDVAQALLAVTESTVSVCPAPLPSAPCGSFPLRSSIGLRGGSYHADVCFEIPEQLCSTADVEQGRYLEVRARVMRDVAVPRLLDAKQQRYQRRFASVELLPVGGDATKHIIRVTVRLPAGAGADASCVVDVHARPRHAGSVNSAKYARRSPAYCGAVLEDLTMVRVATACADMVARCPAFAVAAQFLRKWAVHVGVLPPQDLVAPGTSLAQALCGGLNSFCVVTAPMMLLWGQGTIAPTSSNVDTIVRAVWIFWSQQHPQHASLADSAAAAALQQLVLPTEPHLNVFHRVLALGSPDSIAAVADAAQCALASGESADQLLSQLPGRSLYERFDAIIRLSLPQSSAQGTCAKFGPALKVALASRVSSVVLGTGRAGDDGSDSSTVVVVVGVRFTSESAARSRLFRGPTIDDVPACKAFAELWGASRVSTRQFGDGSIASCVVLPDSCSTGGAAADFADPAAGCRAVCDAVQLLAQRHLVELVVGADGTASASGGSALVRAELCGGAEMLPALWTSDACLGAGSVARDAEPLLYTGRAAACEDLREHINIIAETSLPCRISGIEFLSAAERGTDPFPPVPHIAAMSAAAAAAAGATPLSSAAAVAPIQLVIQIEDKKHKVPDNLDAIATMKSVVLAQLATELIGAKEKFAQLAAASSSSASSAGAGSSGKKKKRVTPQEAVAAAHVPASGGSRMTVHVSKLFADVLHEPSGYVFRIFVLLERELLVLQQLGRGAEAASISRALVWGQRHAEYMRGVIAQRPCVAGACRLLRRWVSAMCLADYVPLEVSELVVAYVSNLATLAGVSSAARQQLAQSGDGSAAAATAPVAGPNTYYTAHTLFLAAVRLMAFYPFHSAPLVFPECDGDKAALAWGDELREQQQQQTAAQQGNTVALRAMFIAAPYTDASHSPFTESTPRRGVMQCLQECARTAWESFARGMAAPGSVVGAEAAVASVFALDAQRSFNFSVPLTQQAVVLFAQQQQLGLLGDQQRLLRSAASRQGAGDDDDDDEAGEGNALFGTGGCPLAQRFVPSMLVRHGAAAAEDADAPAATEEDSRRLLSRAVDHALLTSVRNARMQNRDKCMIFADLFNCSQINGVRFGATLTTRQSAAATTANIAASVANADKNMFRAPQVAPAAQQQHPAAAAVPVKKSGHYQQRRSAGPAAAAASGKKKQQQQQPQRSQKPQAKAGTPAKAHAPRGDEKKRHATTINKKKAKSE